MCLIILCPPGTVPRLRHIVTALTDNSDGCGIAYADGGKVTLEKELHADPDDVWDRLRFAGDRARLVHFRFRTHGAVDLSNVQPFRLSEDLVWAHNGIVAGFGDATRSDSREIAEDHLAGKSLREIRAHQAELDEWFGGYNKTVAMGGDGRFAIGNRKAWVARNGCLWSNEGAFYRARSVHTTSKWATDDEPDWRDDPFYYRDHGPVAHKAR
jgi:predicted glutamine amidotransferase